MENDLPTLTDVTVINCVEFYDGPLTGLARHERRIGWYRVIEETFDDERKFEFVPMTDEEAAAELAADRDNQYISTPQRYHTAPAVGIF